MNPVRALRLSLGLTQEAFADKLDMPVSVVGCYDRGTKPLNEQMAEKIRAAFGLDPDWTNTVDPPEEDHSNPVKELRMKTGLTQERFAFLTGVSRHTIMLAEIGKRMPSEKTMVKMAQAVERKLKK